MRTVKECLQTVNREDVLGALAYDFLCDPIALLEAQDQTVREIQEKYKAHMSRFIDTLLEVAPELSDGKVLFLVDSMLNGSRDHEVLMCDIREVMSGEINYYDCGFTEWKTILGYLVADNKLTRDHIAELLAKLLKEMSWMGTEESAWKERLAEIEDKLDESTKQIDEGRCIPADQVFQELAEEHGIPIDEDDPEQDKLRGLITEAQIKFTEYSRKRELDRIIEKWQEEGGAE